MWRDTDTSNSWEQLNIRLEYEGEKGLSEPGERCSQGEEARGAAVTEGLSHSQNHSAELGSRKGDGRNTSNSLS